MSKLKNISTDKAPCAIGAYSQAIKAGDFIFMSGQIPLDPSTMEIVSDDFSEYRFLNPFRLLDWFALLDLELIETPKYGGLGFPISLNLKKENYLTKFRVGALAPNLVRYPFGGIMFMLAQRKDLVRNMNLIKETRVRHLVPAASFRTIN